jgi:hypothetical protein
MNIGGLISGLKQKVRDRETASAVKVANELKSLKAERVRAEGQKKLYKLRADELSKTQKARAELKQLKKESSVLGRASIAIKKNMDDKKKKGSTKKSIGSETFFGNDSPNAWFPKK